MYNMKLKFESEVRLIPDDAINDILGSCPGAPQIGVNKTFIHTMTITNAEKIPDKKWIENSCQIIKDELSNSLKKYKGKVFSTEFKGYEEIEEI